MAKTKLEEARERLEAAVAAEDACDGGENPLSHVSVSADDLCAILAELDRRSPPTREASPIIERLESIAHHFESSGYAHGQHVDKARAAREAARMIAALAAAPPPPDVSRGLDREEVRPQIVRLIHRALAGDFAGCFLATEQHERIEALADAIIALSAGAA